MPSMVPTTDIAGGVLTPAQQMAVDVVDGPLLILAGPGSGKTRTVTHRIANLLEQRVPPRAILAITFTNKAAREMADRVTGLVGNQPVLVSTFHKICARLLRQYSSFVGLESNYTILDIPDQRRLMKEVLSDLDIDLTHYSPEKVLAFVSNLKNDLITAELFSRKVDEAVADHFQAVVCKAYPKYQAALLASNAVDFDDLLTHVAVMLVENDELRASLSDRYRYILVDEYQDTNAAQYRVIEALGSFHRNVCVTGDPDQSIYGWRGARISNILNFERDFPEAKVVRLEDNFRSTSGILATADGLIAHNRKRKSKTLIARRGDGNTVKVVKYDNGAAEAEAIAAEIVAAVREGQRRYADFAVFYRVNSLSREVEHALNRAGIPYQVAQGTAFYDRAEVKDVLAYLRLLANPADRTAFQRIVNKPARRLGQTSLNRLQKWADTEGLSLLDAASRALECEALGRPARGGFKAFADTIKSISLADCGSVAKLVRAVVDRTGYLAACDRSSDDKAAEMFANVEEVISSAAEYDRRAGNDATLEGFLEESALVSETDSLDPTIESLGSVTLMTLHAAKGLEYPCVYLIGLEQGLLPHDRSLRENTSDEVEEERRLLFVGITRAEDELTITHTAARAIRGRLQITIQSQFLPELDAEFEDRTTDFPTVPDRSFGRGRQRGDEWEEPSFDVNSDLRGDTSEAEADPAGGCNLFNESSQNDDLDAEQAAPRASNPLAGIKLTTAADLLSGAKREVDLSATFHVGQQVRHPHYGLGTVTKLGEVNRRRKVTVDFGSTEETLIIGIAPLEPA